MIKAPKLPMKNQELKDTISRYFRGQLLDNEYDILKEALRSSENKDYFDHAKLDWEQNPELDELGTKNLNRLNYQLTKSIVKIRKPLIHRLWFQVASAAAILVAGLILGSAFPARIDTLATSSELLVFETPRGQKSLVKLPDGTEVWLNARSRLTYHSFSAGHRTVELEGEAFFKVARNEKSPFTVKTDKLEVAVLGTAFNVMAYNEFGRQEIALISGKVTVHSEDTETEINPGQTLVLKDNQTKITDVTYSDPSGWVENKFNFRNIPLSELMKRLENWYDVDITLENLSHREVSFTGTFKNEETIWQVLDAIQVYTPIHYQKTNLRKITISVDSKK